MIGEPAMKPGTVLVTGAGQRLGKAIALDLGGHGWTVAIHYGRSREAAEAVAADITRAGGRAGCFGADLAREVETAALVPRVTDALGPVTALVNCASMFEDDSIETMTRASWDLHMDVNLRAPLVLTQGFAAALPQGTPGSVINLIDQRVWKLTPHFLSYTLSKAALFTATHTLAQALGPRGIRVNAIGPGPTLRNARQSDEDFAKQSAATVLGHGASPDDICAAVRYLLDADAVTGQMIAVDGGQHLVWQTPDVHGIVE
jgi:NAD(P)-dependent dehydrogenase (short-subunit alcohol dehydrogenase family)